MFADLIVWVCLRQARCIPGLKFARYLHLKDRFAGTAAEENDFSSMFRSNAMSEREAEACSLLLALAYKRFKKAVANAFWDAVTIIHDTHNNMLLLGFESYYYTGRSSGGPNSLTGVEQ